MLRLGYFWLTLAGLVCMEAAHDADQNSLPADFPEDLKVCRLDIGFVLDGSGSVGTDNWQRTLDFVKDFTSRLNLDPVNGNRFGVVTFGNNAKLNIGLDDYTTMVDMLSAVDRVKYMDENTNTAAGLRVMRTLLFDPSQTGERGDRPGVQNVAIVVTDGASTREVEQTIPEAERARADNVMMFALGVGSREKLNEDELVAIVGNDRNHLFYLQDFKMLIGSVEDILRASCQIQTSSTTTSTTTTREPLDRPCGNLDIAFLLDASGSVEDVNFQRMRKFARDFINELTVGPANTQVALVSYSSYAKLDFNLNTFQSNAAVLAAMDSLPWWNQMTNTSGALRIAGTRVFGTAADRPESPNLAIVLTDGQSNRDADLVPYEAGKLHKLGVKVMSIGAGKDINMRELGWIASEPQSYYSMMLPSMRNLNDNFKEMFFHICNPERPLLREVLDHRLYPVDLALVMDDGEIPEAHHAKIINTMVAMASELFYGQQFHQIALATTAGGPNFPLKFNDFENREDILNVIQFLQRREGVGNLAVTLEYVHYNLFHRDGGDRENIPNAVVIFTAGIPEYLSADIEKQAIELKKAGTLVLLVSLVPVEVDFEQYMVGLASEPAEIYWFKGYNYPDARELALDLLQAVSMSYVRVDWECTFEIPEEGGKKEACGISQEANKDQFDWTLGSGPTPSQHTGPEKAFSGDYYMFIEASSPRQPGDAAMIYLPFFPDREENWCLRFHYHMRGHHIGSLQVILVIPGSSDDIRWVKYGPQGENWLPGMVSIRVKPGYEIAMRAERAEAFSGDIAIDNLQITRDMCPRLC
jgi:uncharacterized protein YegL